MTTEADLRQRIEARVTQQHQPEQRTAPAFDPLKRQAGFGNTKEAA